MNESQSNLPHLRPETCSAQAHNLRQGMRVVNYYFHSITLVVNLLMSVLVNQKEQGLVGYPGDRCCNCTCRSLHCIFFLLLAIFKAALYSK